MYDSQKTWKLPSYPTGLEAKGFRIAYRGKHRVVAGMNFWPPVFDVETMNNILITRGQGRRSKGSAGDVLMAVLSQNELNSSVDV